MGLRLLADRIAVRPDEAETVSEGGIHLVTEEKVFTGTVVAVGPGSYDKEGNITPVAVNVGDRITYLTSNEQEVEIDGEKLLILVEDAILALHAEDNS